MSEPQLRKIYPHLTSSSSDEVEAFGLLIREIDKYVGSQAPIYKLLASLPDGKLNECDESSKRVLVFSFADERELLTMLQQTEGSIQTLSFSNLTWRGFTNLNLSEYQHASTIQQCKRNRKMLCIILHVRSIIYMSTAITLK